MKKNVLIIIALIAVLTFALQACTVNVGGNSQSPSSVSSKDDGVPSQSSSSASESSKSDESASPVSVNVIEVFHENETVIVWDTEYTNKYSIPAIDSEAANAKALNKKIYDELYGIYTKAQDPDRNLINDLSYTSSVFRGIVAINVKYVAFVPASDIWDNYHFTYYYDAVNDRILESDSDYIEACGYTLEQLNAAAKKTQEYADLMSAGYWYGGSDYEWDTIELSACIFGDEKSEMIFDCTYKDNIEHKEYTFHATMTEEIKTSDLLSKLG